MERGWRGVKTLAPSNSKSASKYLSQNSNRNLTVK
jgi:hypothetical protein